jgi:hypothetical protein
VPHDYYTLHEFNLSKLSRSGTSNPLIRGGMVSGGVMTKAIGRTSTFGTPRTVEVNHFTNILFIIQQIFAAF